jgi:rod shape-determining protein MreD
VTGFDALKATGLVLLAAIVQVSLAEWIEIGEAHPDVVLVTLVAVSLLRGPTYGAVLGFLAGLVLDTASATGAAASARRRPARRRTRS